MISPRALADICAEAYTAEPTWQAGDVAALRVALPAADVIAFRGTEPASLADWLRDFDAIPVPHVGLGLVHRGFLERALALLSLIPAVREPTVLTGHSMGGDLAILVGALSALRLAPPAAIVTFGAARAGGAMLRSALAGVAVTEYRHGDDPVPPMPPFFEHVSPVVQIGVASFDPIDDHLIAGYQAALAAMEAVHG